MGLNVSYNLTVADLLVSVSLVSRLSCSKLFTLLDFLNFIPVKIHSMKTFQFNDEKF